MRQRDRWEVVPAIPFLNSDPITHLVWQSNEAPIVIDRQNVVVLIDLGAQVSNVSSGFCKQMALKVQPLRQAAETRGYWWSHHPILGIC